MSSRPTNFTPAKRPQQRQQAREATDFLQSSDGLASLLPIVETLSCLQADWKRFLPPALSSCNVLKLNENILHVTAPNAAVATRLRHSLPGLTTSLRERGWAIDAIKVSVKTTLSSTSAPRTYAKGPPLSDSALHAFAALAHSIEITPRNAALLSALDSLLSKRRC